MPLCYQHRRLSCIVFLLWEAKVFSDEIVEEVFEQQNIRWLLGYLDE